MVVAQLVERSLPIPEVHDSNPVIGKKLYRTFTVSFVEKSKIKRPGMAHFNNIEKVMQKGVFMLRGWIM